MSLTSPFRFTFTKRQAFLMTTSHPLSLRCVYVPVMSFFLFCLWAVSIAARVHGSILNSSYCLYGNFSLCQAGISCGTFLPKKNLNRWMVGLKSHTGCTPNTHILTWGNLAIKVENREPGETDTSMGSGGLVVKTLVNQLEGHHCQATNACARPLTLKSSVV